VQLSFSGVVVAHGGLPLVYGPLSDRLRRKPVLLAGMVVDRALVQNRFEGPGRTRVMAVVGMTMGQCLPLATSVGGQLHMHLGWQADLVLVTLLAGVAALPAWRGLPATAAWPAPIARPDGWPAMRSACARLAHEPAFLLYAALPGLSTATCYAFPAGAPLVLPGIGHGVLMPPAQAGTVGVVPALAGAAAAVGGVAQQFMDAFGGFVVGLVSHASGVNLGRLMLAFALGGAVAQTARQRRAGRAVARA
jgi:MFS family permease